MYETFYGFREKPFNLTPDPKYLYLSTKHGEAFAHLDFGIKERGGFVVITGEVGTGKTTLCRYFLEQLDESTVSAFILYPAVTAVELLRSVCEDLGIKKHGWTAKEWVDILHRFLLDSRAAGKEIVLVIDEAQNLDPKVLEQIRLISNLETTTEKLLQIVLIGQSELNEVLARPDLRQLAQRVTARYHLKPLSRAETYDYIRHRLGVAGGEGKVSFTAAALRAIRRFSKGIPRLINLVCDRALLAGFVLGKREIDHKMVRSAVSELLVAQKRFQTPWYRSWAFRGLLAGLVLAFAVLTLQPHIPSLLSRITGDATEKTESASKAVEASPTADGGEQKGAEVTGHDGQDTATEPTALPGASQQPAPSLSTSAETKLLPGTAQDLEVRLRTLSKELTRRSAVHALLGWWGVEWGAEGDHFPLGEDLFRIGSHYGLEVTELRTHMGQLRKINLPVVLELFHTSRPDTCYAALGRLTGDRALVAFGPGDEMEVPMSLLEGFWTRQAFVFWKDFEEMGGASAPEPRSLSWVEETLRSLGYLSDGAVSSAKLKAGLAQFQGATDLVPDGVAGPQTRLALYSVSGRYPMPRLLEP